MGNLFMKSEEKIELEPFISSNNFSSHRVHFINEHIDQLTLIWLDANVQEYYPDLLRTKELLKEISNGNNYLFINKLDEFRRVIETMKIKNTKILVIMSGSYANEILPSTYDKINKIIIFCKNYCKYVHLKNEYSNVVEICTEHETLKNCVYQIYPSLKFNLFINQTLTSVRPFSSLQGVDNHNTYFSYTLFIEILKQMPQTPEAIDIMLDKCKDYYNDNHPYRRHIEDYKNSTKPNKAIEWYTRDTFVYRLINQAFRTEDVKLWYLFRFYIIDLCNELEKVHKEQNIQERFIVYRGQSQMPTYELEYLKSNINCLISTNGFLSTTKLRDIAEGFIPGCESTDEFKVVLFEIIVDVPNHKNVVFVDIEKYTRKRGENEILFNIGTVFRIISVSKYDELDVYKIVMEATDIETSEMKEQLDYVRKKFQNGNKNLLFGQLLIDMNQYIKAESYFQMLLQVLPRSHKDLASVYHQIGEVNMRITNWNEAFKNFTLALNIQQKTLCSDHPSIGVTLNSIGNYYKQIGDNVQALKYYVKALRYKSNQYNLIITQLNISIIYIINKKYDRAFMLCLELLVSLQKMNPCPYTDIIYVYGIIGDIFLAQKQYDAANGYYSIALEKSQNLSIIGDCYQINCLKSIANLYHKQGDNQLAINFCSNQLKLYEQHLPSNHLTIAYLLMKISELYEDNNEQKIFTLERALNILEKNIYLEYSTIADCLIMIAEYYQKQNNKENALKYYIRANELQKKIYPKGHRLITDTKFLIDQIKR